MKHIHMSGGVGSDKVCVGRQVGGTPISKIISVTPLLMR